MLRMTVVALVLSAAMVRAADFSGQSAFEFTRKAVEYGTRPLGSDAIKGLQRYILDQLKMCKCEVIEDDFTVRTPRGEVGMKNIIARFPAKPQNGAPRAIAVTGHYDTKYFPGRK